jgi:PTH1 family peptidyl-tRNA hydrolase
MKKPEASDTYLIAGLGNPGREYENNRHNIGFMVADQIARELGVEFTRVQNNALVTKGSHAGKSVVLVKPRTYMNESGRAVSALLRFYKIPVSNLLVVYDDVDLPFETVRLRAEGGSSGQKGMKSVIQHLGTQEFARLRVGIDRPPGRMETPDYVLQDFSAAQRENLPWVLERAAKAALTFVAEGILAAMNEFNAEQE